MARLNGIWGCQTDVENRDGWDKRQILDYQDESSVVYWTKFGDGNEIKISTLNCFNFLSPEDLLRYK
ncbi:hypothetical protein CEXT_416811, partial [Caerostris extrusa]